MPLGPDDWLICIGLSSIVLWADELKKLVAKSAPPSIRAGRDAYQALLVVVWPLSSSTNCDTPSR